MAVSGRVFIASLKPVWNKEKMQKFADSMKGTALVYMINHDRDSNPETGELIEPHTHFLIEYQTPRKILTVANLLEVMPNFIEICKSKKASLRYLIHLDDREKYQYRHEDVIHNNTVDFADLIKGQNLSDKEIAQYLMDSRGMELLGVVSSNKLRTIQSFIDHERRNKIYNRLGELEKQNNKLYKIMEVNRLNLERLMVVAEDFQLALTNSVKKLAPGLVKVQESIVVIAQSMLQNMNRDGKRKLDKIRKS